MKASQAYIYTTKEAPAEAELISHKLMLRAGLIKRLSSGIYTWLPLGLKILRKVEKIVREEMNKIGALELLMPSIQPAEIWQESGRWDFYGRELFRFKDRHDKDFCLGPTHEEVIVDLLKSNLHSYKQLPLIVYQIQTKFRDEVRPRFGIMRSREFIMKDAYSFHSSLESLEATYNLMYQAYTSIFNRLGLKFRSVAADTGSIGGTGSHEFQVLADSGEDIIAYSDESNYAANLELATCQASVPPLATTTSELQKVATFNQTKCEEVAKLLKVPLANTVKSLVYMGINQKPVLVLIRGDHQINEIKLNKLNQLAQPLTFASLPIIKEYFNCQPGFIGPLGFTGLIIADREVANLTNFICGANHTGYHLINVNFGRDCKKPDLIADIRNVVAGDITPDGKGKIKLCRGIEVGHVFQLRTKYAKPMNLSYLNALGQAQVVEMGCYGIGISRIIGAAIEQNNDAQGIIFPVQLAPFELIITPLNYAKSDLVKQWANNLYQELISLGIDVILDDRNERIGSLLADSELLGIPYRIIVGERTLAQNQVEFYSRNNQETKLVNLNQIVSLANETIQMEKN